MRLSPTGPQTEYLPPTQPPKPKTASSGTPNSRVFATALETAAKCLDPPSPSALCSHCLARRAFSIVSAVVKVFDATITNVLAGSSLTSTSEALAPSTFEMKWTLSLPTYGDKAPHAISGPRCDPPIPIFTTSVKRSPVLDRRLPWRISALKQAVASKVFRIPGLMSFPSTIRGGPSGFRRAVCRTALPSVELIGSPSNIASRLPLTSASQASVMRALRTSSSIPVLE